MTARSLLSVQIHVGEIDLTTTSNSMSLPFEVAELDDTTFGSAGWRERVGGLAAASLTHEGFAAFPEPDAELFSQLGAGHPVTVAPSADPADPAYIFQGQRGAYALGGKIGDLFPYAGAVSSTSVADRGSLLLPATTLTGSTTGDEFNLGAVPSGSTLLVALHVFTAGTTATLKVQRDADNTFASATDHLSRTIDATGDTEWIESTTTTTDTWWRVDVSAVTGTFRLAVAAAIHTP